MKYETITQIIEDAKKDRKNDWNIYSKYKREINKFALTNDEYNSAIDELLLALDL